MKKLPLLALALALSPGLAFAQSYGAPPPPPDDATEATPPPSAEPGDLPPAPPAVPPSRDWDDDAVGILQTPSPAARAAPSNPSGQWVFTHQYGWVWMPYGGQYVDEGAYGDSTPYEYVFSVGLGWSWVAAPWLWGWGPYPYFGRFGPARFGWYRGLYHSGYGWGHYRGGGHYVGSYRTVRPLPGSRTYRSYGAVHSYGGGSRSYGHGRVFGGGSYRGGGGRRR